jgi:hypothetical protein
VENLKCNRRGRAGNLNWNRVPSLISSGAPSFPWLAAARPGEMVMI